VLLIYAACNNDMMEFRRKQLYTTDE